MRQILLLGLLIVTGAGRLLAEPPADWKLSEAEGKKWADRVRKVVGREGWSVAVKGNEISVQRDKPVPIVVARPNEPAAVPADKKKPEREQIIRFVLRFAPKVAIEEYERLAAVNLESSREYDRLHKAVGLPHKFGEFIATTPEEKERVSTFRARVAKLPLHPLPDLYTPDNSIFFLHPWDGWSAPADEITAAECQEVEGNLLRYFGMYNPAAATGSAEVGQYSITMDK